MSDLAVVAASVVADSDAGFEQALAAEAVTAGQSVYRTVLKTYGLANSGGAPPQTTLRGIALNNAQAGQPLRIIRTGGLDPGVDMTVGTLYVLSGNNAGGIAPDTDLVSSWVTVPLGVAVETRRLQLTIANPFDSAGIPIQSMDFSNGDNAAYLGFL